jgi:predicted dehydrogenase
MNTLDIAVIGCGHWGPNHVRNFGSLPGCAVRRVADLSSERLATIRAQFPGVATTTVPDEALHAADVAAVVVATPTATHYDLVKRALLAGKHVLCEKPLSLRASESEELTALADERRLTLMVGHVFMFNPGIQYLKAQLDDGRLGRILYLDAVRTNLGPIRQDVGAIFDLASHDVSIFNYLLDAEPLEVSAHGGRYLQREVEDMAYVTLRYADGVVCHAHVSWLNPRKVRQLTVVGDQKMAVWDDLQPLEPVRLYDKGFQEKRYNTFGEFQMMLRDGDITIPKVKMFEPLMRQAQHFVECVREGRRPLADGGNALGVVRVLEACLESLAQGGRMVETRAACREAVP